MLPEGVTQCQGSEGDIKVHSKQVAKSDLTSGKTIQARRVRKQEDTVKKGVGVGESAKSKTYYKSIQLKDL